MVLMTSIYFLKFCTGQKYFFYDHRHHLVDDVDDKHDDVDDKHDDVDDKHDDVNEKNDDVDDVYDKHDDVEAGACVGARKLSWLIWPSSLRQGYPAQPPACCYHFILGPCRYKYKYN